MASVEMNWLAENGSVRLHIKTVPPWVRPFDQVGTYSAFEFDPYRLEHGAACSRTLAVCADRCGRSPIGACPPPELGFPAADRK
jgi:hypothetical protein